MFFEYIGSCLRKNERGIKKTCHLFLLLIILTLVGCEQYDFDTQVGYVLHKKITKADSCKEQANIYAWLIDGRAMGNKKHAFVVKDGQVYDSTQMQYTGLSVNDKKVKEYYGDKKTWYKIENLGG